jgi:hypothetical protein
MTSFSNLCTNTVTNINTEKLRFELYENKKWRVYNCKFCGWIFYSHDISNHLRCPCCEYTIKFETFDCSHCRSIVEPDNCVENNSCKQFLCQGKIIKCNNKLGIYYKDWISLIENDDTMVDNILYCNIK